MKKLKNSPIAHCAAFSHRLFNREHFSPFLCFNVLCSNVSQHERTSPSPSLSRSLFTVCTLYDTKHATGKIGTARKRVIELIEVKVLCRGVGMKF